MPKIKMDRPSKTLTLERAFREFKVSHAAKGIKDKTLETYGFHFHAASGTMASPNEALAPASETVATSQTKSYLKVLCWSISVTRSTYRTQLHISTIFSSSRILLLVFAELSTACR